MGKTCWRGRGGGASTPTTLCHRKVNTINGIRDEKLEKRDSVITPLWLFVQQINLYCHLERWWMSSLGGSMPWGRVLSMGVEEGWDVVLQIGGCRGLVGFGLVLGFYCGGCCEWVGAWGLWLAGAIIPWIVLFVLDFPWAPALRTWVFLFWDPDSGSLSAGPFLVPSCLWGGAYHWGCFLTVMCGALWAVRIFF